MQNFSCSDPLTHNISESINYQVNPSLPFSSGRFCVPPKALEASPPAAAGWPASLAAAPSPGQPAAGGSTALPRARASSPRELLERWSAGAESGLSRLDKPSPWTYVMVLEQAPNVILNFTSS